jgi:2-C-methyl-D-erythritol 2,4-cyclodiphosphate synthase
MMRVGIGYDSHKFAEGEYVPVGGVKIPYDRGVKAHSDGDVLLHALVDALLGAAALGDIGSHFPDTDPQFAGMESAGFVMHTMQLLKQHNLQLNNMDATIIAEAPKMAKHIPAIREHLSDLLQVPITQISVKATTNEKMGWIGRQEGLAATVIVSISNLS